MEIFAKNPFYQLYPKDTSNINLTNLLFARKTPYDLIINPIFNVQRYSLARMQYQDIPFWYDQKILWGLNPYEELIFKVLVNGPSNLFKKGFIYYFRNFAIYETLQNAIDEVNEIETTQQQVIYLGLPSQTYRPQRFKHYANNYHIYSAPEPYAFDYGPFPDTCTIETGSYTIVCKYNPYNSNTTFSGFFDYSYTYTDANDDEITTVNNLPVNILIAVPNNLGETGGATDTVVTISIYHIGIGASVSKTITEPHASFPLTDTVVPNIDGHDLPSPGYDYLNDYFLDLDEITYTFSGEIIFPQELRVNLPNAYFTGEGGDVLGENIDEILTLDLESGCYVSDIKNYYNIPGRLLIETAIWGPSGTGFKFFIGPIDFNGYSIHRLNVGKRFYDNIYYDWFSQIKQNENNTANKYTAVISTGNTDIYSENNTFTDFGYHINGTAVARDGYIAPRLKYYVDTLDENASEHNVGQGIRLGFDWSGGVHNVSYSIFTSCRKVYGELYDYENEPDDYYPPWHPSQNFFKNPRFFLASISAEAFISSVRIGAAPNAPTITFNDDAIEQDAESFTIAGTDFNLDYEDNLVTFNLGAVGIVTAATTTQLTVTFTTQPTSLGNLEVTLLMPLSSGAAVQVATVVAGIVVTTNPDSRAINAPTLVIAGTGFSATANENTVTFNLGAVGTVTSATTTELTVTFSTQPTATGSLTAVIAVSTSNGDSGAAIEVATIVAAPTVSLNAAYFPIDDSELIISGTGFDAVTPANNLVTFNHGAVGTVTAATTTQLTVSMDTQPNQTGNFTAFVNSFGGDSNTEIVGAAITDLVGIESIENIYEIDYENFWTVETSGAGTVNNPFNISVVLDTISYNNLEYEDIDIIIKINFTFPSGAVFNWSGTWEDRNFAEMIMYLGDQFTNPVPPPTYLPTTSVAFVEYYHVGDNDSYTGSGSMPLLNNYSVGPGTFTAEFQLEIRRVEVVSPESTSPSINVNLWATY